MSINTFMQKPSNTICALFIAGCLPFLSACTVAPVNVEDNYRFRPPVGTVVELHTNLQVPAGRSQAYIQQGKTILSKSKVESYLPWCEFRISRSAEDMQSNFVIDKATFVVAASHRAIDYSAIERLMQPMLLAGRERILWPAHPEASMENMATYMRLKPTQQPQVAAVVCMIFSDALSVNHLTLREIRSTLGDIATIQLPSVIAQ